MVLDIHVKNYWPLSSIFSNGSQISFMQDTPRNIHPKLGCKVVSEKKNFQRNTIENSKKTLKKGNKSNMAYQINTKIWPQVDLIMLNTLAYVRSGLNLMVFEIYVKNYCLTPMFYF